MGYFNNELLSATNLKGLITLAGVSPSFLKGENEMGDSVEISSTTGPKETDEVPHIATCCPKCGHKFWHKIGDGIKAAVANLGNAIGEAKFGGD